MVISMLKIRRPLGRLIFNMGIAIPGKTVFLIETAPWKIWENLVRLLTTNKTKHKSCACSWWRHQMETFSALLAICAGNAPVPGEFPAQRPVTRSSDVFFDLRPITSLSKQSRDWWFETPSGPLWRHRNVLGMHCNCQRFGNNLAR